MRAELEHCFEVGGLEEAVLRALVYIRLPEGSVDERGFAVLRLIRASRPAAKRMSLARFKEMMREQYLLVRLDEERAVSALPKLLGEDAVARKSGAGCPASGSGRAWRHVGRRHAPPGAGRDAVRCAADRRSSSGGGACLTPPTASTPVPHDKYERLIKAAQAEATIKVAVAHPCDDVSLGGAVEAARLRLIEPILVGPEAAHPRCRRALPVSISPASRSCRRNTATTPRPRRWNW